MDAMATTQVTVLGGGSWGTTVAALAAANTPTIMWARDPEVAREIHEEHRNSKYLGDRTLPDSLRHTAGYAAAAVVATLDAHVAKALQPLFRSDVFRVYRNKDVLGSEMGGVLKNIVAIAAGMADGIGVGDNTRALVITRGLAEITRLGKA